jgi:hypothetical protein
VRPVAVAEEARHCSARHPVGEPAAGQEVRRELALRPEVRLRAERLAALAVEPGVLPDAVLHPGGHLPACRGRHLDGPRDHVLPVHVLRDRGVRLRAVLAEQLAVLAVARPEGPDAQQAEQQQEVVAEVVGPRAQADALPEAAVEGAVRDGPQEVQPARAAAQAEQPEEEAVEVVAAEPGVLPEAEVVAGPQASGVAVAQPASAVLPSFRQRAAEPAPAESRRVQSVRRAGSRDRHSIHRQPVLQPERQ